MGQIFDHREVEMGLRRLARTFSESVGERWRYSVGILPDLGYPVTPMLAHMLWRGRSMGQIFDHRETEMGLCQLARTVSESVEERWRDGVGSLPDLGYPVTPMLAHTVRATDFGFSTLKDSYRRTSSKSDRNTCRSRADMLSILDTTWSA